ncbi:MAG TPA: ribosome maturation factor RimM [Burkholderiales bacterium]|nr:ribosome maturation factor RimM [Burkholderiales bacterium]
MATETGLVVMGRVAGPFAVRGWIKVLPFTQLPDNLLYYRRWWIGCDSAWREVAVEEGAVQGRTVVAKLSGVESREDAARLSGCDVAVPRAALPAAGAGEYYWSDLVGLQVRNQRGELLGVVSGLLETGANDVLVVQAEKERLIPFVDAIVRSVDVERQLIVVDWETDF